MQTTLVTFASAIPAVGLPEGRTFSSYFAAVSGASIAVGLIGIVAIWVAHRVLIRGEGDVKQLLGYVVIAIFIVWPVATGLIACQEIMKGLWTATWAFVTSK